MATLLNPYLNFAGNAREAMELYASVLGGSLTLMTFGDAGAPGMPPEQVMHARLDAPSGTLMASDIPPGMEHQPGNTISVSLSGDDAEALRGHWAALCEGGQVTMPLERQMWGDDFGMCVDRFGVAWMVNIGAPQE